MTNCGGCIYWHRHPGMNEDDYGVCKRFPPQPDIQVVVFSMSNYTAEELKENTLVNEPTPIWWSYPVTNYYLPSCGEYNPEVKQ